MYLYFIRCRSHAAKKVAKSNKLDKFRPIKIGVSDNPKKRLQQLQIGCPYELEIINCFKMRNRKHAFYVENTIHKICAHKKKHYFGEWFHGGILKMKMVKQIISVMTDTIDKEED